MKITFTGHSGFYAELDHMNLLFDYFSGRLPKPDPEKPLFVFVSHVHEDHFSEKIFSLAEQTEDVTYFISNDVPADRIPERVRDQVRFVQPNGAYAVSRLVFDPAMNRKRGRTILEIHTYASTDEGVAFLIDAEGKRLYHAGDLNDWHWDEEDQVWNEDQRKRYGSALLMMKALVKKDDHAPDAAFIPVDSRLGEFYWMGLDEYMKTVGAAYIFPMHLFGDSSVIEKMKALPCAAEYRDRILGTGTKGEQFNL